VREGNRGCEKKKMNSSLSLEVLIHSILDTLSTFIITGFCTPHPLPTIPVILKIWEEWRGWEGRGYSTSVSQLP